MRNLFNTAQVYVGRLSYVWPYIRDCFGIRNYMLLLLNRCSQIY